VIPQTTSPPLTTTNPSTNPTPTAAPTSNFISSRDPSVVINNNQNPQKKNPWPAWSIAITTISAVLIVSAITILIILTFKK
jgi:hypothetical protein